jgi:hypothetical protein
MSMADKFVVADLEVALHKRALPTITVYNRLEGRPRTISFERALKAEVRDALWMLTRQWQVGEFEGDDAGSPFLAKLQLARTELTKYRPGDEATQPFDARLPLEARVERRPVHLTLAGRAIALDLRLIMGRQWLKLIADIGNYRQAFLDAYPISAPDLSLYRAAFLEQDPAVPPDPALVSGADRAAHPEVWQAFAAVAGRSMDGGALYEHLKQGPAHHAYDGIAGITTDAERQEFDKRATRFVAWFERLFLQPPDGGENAWDASKLEYGFACSAPEPAGEKVYAAGEYYGGHLDWWAFDVDRVGPALGDSGVPPTPVPPPDDPRTLIPTTVRFEGMPNTRWWAFEDNRTNFGDVDAATTDLAKLLLLEFGLVYGNDWFLIPAELAPGSIADVRGIAVTNVFGERFWIEAAGAGPDDAWQRWAMFTVNVQSTNPDEPADTSLLLPPTVPKIQESDPLEEVLLIRDEMANMVWGVERTVSLASGDSKPGSEAGREMLTLLRHLFGGPELPPANRVADVRYQVMSSVPEQWIPFIPVHLPGDVRKIQLQRASLPRIIEGGTPLPAELSSVHPRTVLLREHLDGSGDRRYFIHEEQVPRAGTRLTQSFQRTRWRNGRAVVWLGVLRETGRGEGSSGLAFDQLIDVPPET